MTTLTKIINDIYNNNGTVYYVGGTVRDMLLQRENKDIDVEIHDISVDTVKQILSKYGQVDEIGASFGVLMLKGLDVDFTFPRTESLTGNKHTDFKMNVDPYLSIEKASKRRDFTMNAIMKNVITGEIIDLYGGQTDIRNKMIKFVDKDTFIEDPLRSLRAAQFASRLGFTIDLSVIELAKQMDYTNLSNERIITELNKALLSPKPSVALQYLLDMGVLKQVLPELDALQYAEQDENHHPEGNVWNHTLMVVDKAAQLRSSANHPLWFMYASLFHDIGKIKTTTRETINGVTCIHSYAHDKIGASMIIATLGKLTNEKNLITYVSKLTEYHMTMHWHDKLTDKKFRRIMIDVDIHDLILLNTADKNGRGGITEKDYATIQDHISKLTKRVEKLSTHSFGEIRPYFTGKDILALGVTPGKKVGRLLNEAYKEQLNGKSRQTIHDMLKQRTTKHIVTSQELIDMGIPTGPIFGKIKQYIADLELQGYTHDEIITNIKENYK